MGDGNGKSFPLVWKNVPERKGQNADIWRSFQPKSPRSGELKIFPTGSEVPAWDADLHMARRGLEKKNPEPAGGSGWVVGE
jgi:hypothetical protein